MEPKQAPGSWCVVLNIRFPDLMAISIIKQGSPVFGGRPTKVGPEGIHLLLAPQNNFLGDSDARGIFETLKCKVAQNETVNVATHFLNKVRKARAVYRANRDTEDDISLIFVSFSNQNLELKKTMNFSSHKAG